MFYLCSVNNEGNSSASHCFRGSKLRKILRHNPVLYYFNKQLKGLIPACSLLVPILLVMFPASVFAQSTAAVHTVVIDAGHGGHDPGALGSHSRVSGARLGALFGGEESGGGCAIDVRCLRHSRLRRACGQLARRDGVVRDYENPPNPEALLA